ncbi:MAG TPA: hypothetical protein VLE27_11700 [Thermoanaerobaculia bacterium]|nr:hypothetical protein [Thermoanaerobaculia bacterium]
MRDVLLAIPRWLLGVAALLLVLIIAYALFFAKCTVFVFGLEFGPDRPCECDEDSGSERSVDLGGFKWKIDDDEVVLDASGEVLLGVEIDVLEDGIRWQCGSNSELARGGKTVQLADVIRGYGRERELKDVKGIIAVGAASAEGLTSGQEVLAQHRMEEMIRLLDANLSVPKTPIYGFWVGQNTRGKREAPCNEATSDQRRVLMLKITEIKAGMSFEELEAKIEYLLVKRAKEEGVLFPIDVRDYSRFQRREDLLVWGRNIAPVQRKIKESPAL